MSTVKNIQHFWECFIQSEQLSYERSAWLDLFLAEFLSEIKQGKEVQDVLSFCLQSSVASLVSCELLSDVRQICSAPGNDENLAPVLNHFLRGRGWRCLAVLQHLGSQALSCCKELAELLVRLYTACLENPSKIKNTSTNAYLIQNTDFNIDTFNIRIPIKYKHKPANSLYPPPRKEFLRSHSSTSAHRTRRGRTPVCSDSNKNSGPVATSESEHGAEELDIPHNRSYTLKIRLDPMDFDYFTSVVRSDDESRLDSPNYTPRRRLRDKFKEVKKSPLDFRNDSLMDVLNSGISVYEFQHIIIKLLQCLCSVDVSVSTDNSHHAAVQVIKFAQKNLCTLQFGSAPTESLGPEEIAELKSSMCHLFLVALERVLYHPELTSTVIHNGILPVMLEILEDAVSKISICAKMTEEADATPDNSEELSVNLAAAMALRPLLPEEASKIHEFVYGMTYGIMSFLNCLLFQRSTNEKLSDYLELFQLFSECYSGRLIERTVVVILSIPFVSAQVSLSRARKILDLVGQLITSMKKVRGEIVHLNQCRRSRHKQCNGLVSGMGNWHHNDLFGGTYSCSVVMSGSQHSCCVASLFMVLVRIIQNQVSAVIVPKVLKVMTLCGTCCCIPARTLISTMVAFFKKCDARCRSLGLTLLEKTIYAELGAFSKSDSEMPCIVCNKNASLNLAFMKSLQSADYSVEESLFEASLPRDPNVLQARSRSVSDTSSAKTSWNCMELFKELLDPSNPKLCHAVMSHLLKISPRCSSSVKYELLFNVFFPTFLSAKISYSDDQSDILKFTILSCLSMFSSLLGTIPFAEQFVTYQQGLDHILQLISLGPFSKLCCAIMEITATLEIWKLEHDSNLPMHSFNSSEMKNLPSLIMLHNSVESSTSYILPYIKFGPIKEEFVEGAGTSDTDKDADISNGNLSVTSCISGNINIPVLDSNTYLEMLGNVAVFWRSCANIAMYSPWYRNFLSQEPLGKYGYQVLMYAIQRIISNNFRSGSGECQSSSRERHLYMKLIEATLTTALTASPLSDVSGSCVQSSPVFGNVRNVVLSGELTSDSVIRQLTDVLVRCAVTECSQEQVMPPNRKPKLPILVAAATWDESFSDDESDGKDGRSASADNSSVEEAYVTADEGYEADVEVLEWQASRPRRRDTGSSVVSEYIQSRNIVHPSLCMLTVELLVQWNERFFEKRYSNSGDESTHWSALAYSLQRLVALCRDNPHNCAVFAQSHITTNLLQGFSNILTIVDPKLVDVQRLVMELVTLLARHMITPKQLALYLNFFKAENPPLEVLLSSLIRLATASKPQPNYILSFPIQVTAHAELASSSMFTDVENFGKTLHHQHISSGICSSWSNCALMLPIGSDLGWSMWLNGFSLGLWLRSESAEAPETFNMTYQNCTSQSDSNSSLSEWGIISDNWRKESVFQNVQMPVSNDGSYVKNPVYDGENMHLFSIGYESLMLECWSAPSLNTLTLRLTRPDATSNIVLTESVMQNCDLAGQWHHLAFNVRDFVRKRQTVIEVTILTDGWHSSVVQMSFSGVLVHKPSPSCLLLGQICHGSRPFTAKSWYLGSVMLFRSSVFTKESAVYLVGLGPNHVSLTDCDVDKQGANFTWVFGSETLCANINWDCVLQEKKANLKELQDKVLMTYSAQNPSVVNLYPQVMTSPGGMVGSLFPGQTGFHFVTLDQRACQQLPLSVQPVVFTTVVSHQYQGLVAAATVLGGTPVFLFLFARVVELKASAEVQAKALYLLLKLVQSDAELFSQFIAQECHKLLLKVLSSSRCIPGHHVLKAILDACCDKPVVQYHSGQQIFQLVQQSDAIVVNSFLLSTIVGCWRDWERVPEEGEDKRGVLGTLFSALHILLRDDHPFREFNAMQLNRVHMVEAILMFCKERFLHEESPELSHLVCCSLVELIRSLMGAPPEFCHIVTIADFLVLVHRASVTYVTHLRSSFYFLLSSDDPSALHSASSSKRGSEKWLLKGKRHVGDSSFAQPVDPQKLNKALTNLQIKQSSRDYSDSGVHCHGNLTRSASLPMDSNRVEEENSDSGLAGSYREDISSQKAKAGSFVNEQNNAAVFPTHSPKSPHQSDRRKNDKNGNESKKPLAETERELEDSSPENISKSWCCNGQSLVVEGLLLLLRDTLLVLPDNMAPQILSHVVRIEALLIMANHPDPRVSSAVVKVIDAYLQRSTDEEINKFLKLKGFHQLGNQLALHQATTEVVEACVALVTHCNVPLEEQLDSFVLTELSFLQLHSFPPVLALLPCTVHSVSLTHNLLFFLRDLNGKVNQALRCMLDSGLIESLIKTLVALSHTSFEKSDLCGVNEQDILLSDIHMFFLSIARQVLVMPGAHHMQVLNDILLQLSYVEKRERNSCGAESSCSKIIRDARCIVLQGSLDILLELVYSIHSKTYSKRNINVASSFFQSVLSTGNDDISSGYPWKPFSSNTGSFATIPGSLSKSHIRGRDVSRGEINDRLKCVLSKSVDFLVYVEPNSDGCHIPGSVEQSFLRRLLSTILQAADTVLDKKNINQKSPLWTVRDSLRVHSVNLILGLLAPYQPVRTRMYVVHTLHGEPRAKELLTSVLQTTGQLEQLNVSLWDLTHCNEGQLSNSELRSCQELEDDLHEWGLIPQDVNNLCEDDVQLLLGEVEKQYRVWERQIEMSISRSVHKLEGLMKSVADAAMSITRTVVEMQNAERKAFMEHIKMSYSEGVQIRMRWQKIVQQLTHERAVWFFPKSYPRSWQLDMTEGPARVRNRLQRCHLNVASKYLLPNARDKLEAVDRSTPLLYLFEHDKQSSTSTVLIERLHTNEKIQHMCAARVVTPAKEVPGELLIGETSLYFIADDSILETDLHEATAGGLDVSSTAWPFENVREIHNRRFQLQERGLEIFLLNGKTYLIAFESSKERDKFVQELSLCHWPNRITSDTLSTTLQLWREGFLTNWEYITQLNKIAGRSYNDLMQYPVFPFVLSDYKSPVLDLGNPRVYRNFKKPMAVQDKKNEQHYINNYNYLKQELSEGFNLMAINQEPYHYGSHYSNSGTVLHFLVRLPPFTRMFLSYQDNNFDLPDRTFHCMNTTWRLASSDSTTDVKELIPEFFVLPEFLVNFEDFNFGVRQSGERVHNVDLPAWCNGNPRLFILIHRQALESDFVRENLPSWIDLVFGYKQTGKAAVDAINVFHPATYYGFNVESIEDPLERNAWETMVRTYGQTPRQLFRTPHPMVVQSLSTRMPAFAMPDVIPTVKGLTWGNYVGSPSDPDLIVVWKHQHKTPVVGLVPLLTNDVFGLASHTSLLLCYNKEKGSSMVSTTSILGAALVTWGHTDSVVRVKSKKELPPWPLVKSTGLDPISMCASSPDCGQLWIGHWSGRILVYEYSFSRSQNLINFHGEPTMLLGHESVVLSIVLCTSFSIVVSGSQDGTAVMWDLNSLTYIRSIGHIGDSPIRMVSVSETLGDVVTVSDVETGSKLSFYSINAQAIGTVLLKEYVTALCFSNAPEGVSVNVLVAGLATGILRFFSTWDLTVVRELDSHIASPVISLTYSNDAQHLYVSMGNGFVVIWEGSASKGIRKTPKFLNLTSL